MNGHETLNEHWTLTRARSHEVCGFLPSRWSNQPEAGVLVEVRAEVVSREHARLVAGAGKAPAHDDVVLSIEAGGGKVLLESDQEGNEGCDTRWRCQVQNR